METNYIELLQENLRTIRTIANLTCEELGSRIGAKKQTISNLENKKTKMTKAQYIALRVAIDYEIVNTSNEILFDATRLLLDGYINELSEEEKKEVIEGISITAAAIKGGSSMTVLAVLYDKLVDRIISKIDFQETMDDILIPKALYSIFE